ncbi:MAG: YebC/PmpR family DNA-binding transcriptional regulator [Patescibacteria group bacterium]|nr:YebC/PmpR family DNA-binding transcriptional regulator [Patescibacteria group bacterium]
MAGHSHWAQVKHKKAVVDAKRSQLVSKLIRAITIAARENNNIESNYKLRSAVERAKNFQISLQTIERAIKKAEESSEKLEEIVYEAYFDEVQILIRAITDNRNRTLGEIKHILNRFNCRLAEPGSVKWNFQEKASVVCDRKDEEKILEFVDYYDDLLIQNDDILLITSLAKLNSLREKLDEAGIEVKDSGIGLIPISTIDIDPNKKEILNSLVEQLLSLDDVEEVFTNLKT